MCFFSNANWTKIFFNLVEDLPKSQFKKLKKKGKEKENPWLPVATS